MVIKIEIDYSSPIPVYEQIKQSIKLNILNGEFRENEKIISIRELARKIGVNQNTILKAYYQLDMDGYIYSKPGQGYFAAKVKKGNEKSVLDELTAEYVNKAVSLGFNQEMILKVIKKYTGDE